MTKPIRLAEAIRESYFDAPVLRLVESGEIVTPADQALAKVKDPFVQEGNYWNCVGCGNPKMWPSGTSGHVDCAWVKAKAKVAALEAQR